MCGGGEGAGEPTRTIISSLFQASTRRGIPLLVYIYNMHIYGLESSVPYRLDQGSAEYRYPSIHTHISFPSITTRAETRKANLAGGWIPLVQWEGEREREPDIRKTSWPLGHEEVERGKGVCLSEEGSLETRSR